MSSTIETANTNILTKISELKSILSVYNQYDLETKDNELIEQLEKQINEIEISYETGSIDILSQYHKNKHDIERKNEIYEKYMKYITLENFINKLKRIYNICSRLQRTYKIDDKELYNSFSNYEMMPITIQYDNKANKKCKCGNEFTIEEKTSEYICHNCGSVERLFGIVFEDEQFYFQEGQRTKHGKYDPTKHCKFWVDRIQAKENTEIPNKVIEKVKHCLKRDSIWLDQITSPMIRSYLKELRLTKYNDHIALIRKIITGMEPEQLTDLELRLVYIYFSRVIQIYNKTKPDNKPNCPYHPFFIYKILEQILKEPEQEARKKNIISYIHLQSRETLIENDIIWKSICNEIDEFEYVPTDPN